MKKSRRVLLAIACLCALFLNGAGALAQTQERMPPPTPRGGEPRIMIRTNQPDGAGVIVNGQMKQAGDGYDIRFFSSEMSFDGHVVKGAPYSAEAVTESVQMLGDGNRIVRKSAARVYRDGEGRTRRELNMNNVGPFATAAGDAPQMIFINDPVAGVNYILDARTHTARKMSFAFSTDNGGTLFQFKRMGPPPGSPGAPPPPRGMDGPPPGADAPPPPDAPGGMRHVAVKRVQPQYPPIAKAAGAQGPVTVQVLIDEQGNVTTARAISGHPLLQDASVSAARQWVFKPTLVNGKPAKVSGAISFSFALADDREDGAQTPPPPQGPPAQETKESLGRQTVEGVEAEGTRTTVTIPVGAIGNERAINIVDERWYSPELQTVVMTKHSDPRYGENSYRLTNINRSEPARSLFEVPADFTIKTGDMMQREFRMKRELNEQERQQQ